VEGGGPCSVLSFLASSNSVRTCHAGEEFASFLTQGCCASQKRGKGFQRFQTRSCTMGILPCHKTAPHLKQPPPPCHNPSPVTGSTNCPRQQFLKRLAVPWFVSPEHPSRVTPGPRFLKSEQYAPPFSIPHTLVLPGLCENGGGTFPSCKDRRGDSPLAGTEAWPATVRRGCLA